MTNDQKIINFCQSVYRERTGKYFEDIGEEDGQNYITLTLDWLNNNFLDDFELEADWNFVRDPVKEIGTITSALQTFPLPATTRKLTVEEGVQLVITQDGSVISHWDVVDPKGIKPLNNTGYDDRVTFVGRKLVFSRSFNENEIGGTIIADVIDYIPRVSTEDTTAFDIVKPYKLMILGVAKDATLPDTVQSGISPALTQRYTDLIDRAKLENLASSTPGTYTAEDLSYLGGIR